MRLQDWMKCELLACLDWLWDTEEAKCQRDPQRLLASTRRVQNVQTKGGGNMDQEDVNEL